MTWKDRIRKDDRKKFRELQKDADILADYLEDLDKMETRIVDSIVDLREIREELPQFKDYVNKMLKSFNEVTVNLKRLESTLDTEYTKMMDEAKGMHPDPMFRE
tara:strand:+ start:51 stop:362 length:312 start_codon:yes stop_codon:yes gene_type:complete